MKIQELLEAIPLRKAKEYRKEWDPNTYLALFKSQPYEHDKNYFRLYIPVEYEQDKDQVEKPLVVPPEVEKQVKDKGYEIVDYKNGLAAKKDDKKRQIRIGKLLADNETAKKAYEQDPQRALVKAAKEKFLVCISRHPYDVAGSSTDRGWTSCMNLIGGINRHYVAADVQKGTIVAYLIKESDKNIKNPISRILIKPFISKASKKDILLVPEQRTYGTNSPAFTKAVEHFCKKVNAGRAAGLYCVKSGLYKDTAAMGKKILHGDIKSMSQAALKKLPIDSVLDAGFVLIDGTFYQANELPENLTVETNLDLSRYKINYLPKNLSVKGLLNISQSKLKELPENLNVGTLKARHSSLEKLSNSFKCNGSIELGYSDIKEWPDALTEVNGNLDLEETPIKSLPDNLKVKKDLNINYCESLKQLPNNLIVGMNLYMLGAGIEVLPQSAKVSGKVIK